MDSWALTPSLVAAGLILGHALVFCCPWALGSGPLASSFMPVGIIHGLALGSCPRALGSGPHLASWMAIGILGWAGPRALVFWPHDVLAHRSACCWWWWWWWCRDCRCCWTSCRWSSPRHPSLYSSLPSFIPSPRWASSEWPDLREGLSARCPPSIPASPGIEREGGPADSAKEGNIPVNAGGGVGDFCAAGPGDKGHKEPLLASSPFRTPETALEAGGWWGVTAFTSKLIFFPAPGFESLAAPLSFATPKSKPPFFFHYPF